MSSVAASPGQPPQISAIAAIDRDAAIVSASSDSTARGAFWAFVAAHVTLWTAMPAITHANRPLDMVEMLYWGRAWQWGYYKHPPLPAWIAEAVFELSGGAVWPLYLVGQVAVAICFWAAWKLAREFMAPWPALCAAVLLEACSYYNLTTADINNSIVLQPLWALAALNFYRALTLSRLRHWLALGACVGLGLLAKYDMAVLASSMLLLTVLNREARAAWRSPGPYAAIAIALLIVSPHVLWLVQNDFPTIHYAVKRAGSQRPWWGHIVNPLEFLLSQALAQLPMFAIAWPAWRKRDRTTSRPDLDRLRRDFLLAICLGPLVIDLALSLLTGVKLQSLWGMPMWTFTGLAIMLSLGRRADQRALKLIAAGCAAVGLLIVAAIAARSEVLPYLRGKPSRVHYPGAALGAAVERHWREACDAPLAIIAGQWWPAANAGLHLGLRTQIYDVFHPEASPWINDDLLRERGGVIVWEDDDDSPECFEAVAERFPEAIGQPSFELNWQTNAQLPPVKFCMAVVLPAGTLPNTNGRVPARSREPRAQLDPVSPKH